MLHPRKFLFANRLDLGFRFLALRLMLAVVLLSPASAAQSGNFGDSRILVGDRGDEVSTVRCMLARLSFFTGVVRHRDTFGIALLNAVKKFQTEHGIEPVGNVGLKTLAALGKNVRIWNDCIDAPHREIEPFKECARGHRGSRNLRKGKTPQKPSRTV